MEIYIRTLAGLLLIGLLTLLAIGRREQLRIERHKKLRKNAFLTNITFFKDWKYAASLERRSSLSQEIVRHWVALPSELRDEAYTDMIRWAIFHNHRGSDWHSYRNIVHGALGTLPRLLSGMEYELPDFLLYTKYSD